MIGMDAESPIFQLESVGVKATAQLRGDQFVVFKGSQARVEVVDSYETGVTTTYKLLRSTLIDQGKLQLTGGVYVFTEDVAFDAPTPAAIVVTGRNDGGPKNWKRSLDNDQQQTYGQWLQENLSSLPPNITAQLLEPDDTTWQTFFKELAHKLLEYEERQPELVQILRNAGVTIQPDDGEPLEVIDPFTVFVLIHKSSKLETVQPILTHLKSALGLESPIPEELFAVPSIIPSGAWFFPRRTERQPDTISTLWQLARQAVTGTLETATFAAALQIKHLKLAKLTQGLFWLNPTAFLTLSKTNIAYLEMRGVLGTAKVQSLPQLTTILDAARLLAPNFVTLSHIALLEKKLPKEIAALEDGRFPWIAFQEDAAKHPTDHAKGNMLLDDKYAPLLLELTEETSLSALKPSRSPFKGRTRFAVRIALSAAEDGPFAHALLVANEDLRLTVGIREGRAEAFRHALRSPETQQRLLEALMSDTVQQHPTRLMIDTFVVPIIIARSSDMIAEQLEALADSVKPINRFQVDLTLLPSILYSEDFTSYFESALRYADELKGVLDDMARTALPISPPPAAIQAMDIVMNEEPLGFTPPPGVPLNQILYGPPGTGKTFRVVDEALRVLEPQMLVAHPGSEGRASRKARYDALAANGQITFTTFHQSFGYEDFIEGIKPAMQGGQLHYELEDGLFLQAVRAAGGMLEGGDSVPAPAEADAVPTVNPDGQVWRIYIDGTGPNSQLRQRSLERGEIRIGSWLKHPSAFQDRVAVNQTAPQDLNTLSEDELHPQQIMFRDSVRIGDLVLLATGQDSVGAVGVVTGDYFFDQSENIFTTEYSHVRPVQWLAKNLSWRATELTGKKFAPTTLHRVLGLPPKRVYELLNGAAQVATTPSSALRPHVLIIDEINRGNVAKVFGELITLLEPSKRAGAAEGLTVRLPLSKRQFSVPQSLYIIGTMNTADRSLTALDAALRRRFVFHPVWPDPSILPVLDLDGTALDLPAFLSAINQRIERLLSREQMIGHAYLLDIPASLEGVAQALQQRILPLLEEYFFEDWGLIRQVLNDPDKPSEQQFIRQIAVGDSQRFERNPRAFENIEAFVRVYSGSKDLNEG